MLLYAPLPDLRGEHWTKSVPPEPHRFVADIDTALEQNILDLSQRKRIANIHHHHEADHLGRTVEITEGIAHCRRLRNLARRLNPIYSDNALARLAPNVPDDLLGRGFRTHRFLSHLRSLRSLR